MDNTESPYGHLIPNANPISFKYTLSWNHGQSVCGFDTKEDLIHFINNDFSNVERFNKGKTESHLLAEIAEISHKQAIELIQSCLAAFSISETKYYCGKCRKYMSGLCGYPMDDYSGICLECEEYEKQLIQLSKLV